MHNILTIYQSK